MLVITTNSLGKRKDRMRITVGTLVERTSMDTEALLQRLFQGLILVRGMVDR